MRKAWKQTEIHIIRNTHKQQAMGQEEIASNCTMGSLDWTLGKASSPKVRSSPGAGCTGKWLE